MKYDIAVARGIVQTRTGSWRIGVTTYTKTTCSVCGEVCFVIRSLLIASGRAVCSRSCAGRRSPLKAGESRLSVSGYRVRYMPDHPMSDKAGRLLEHRLVMSEHLGRLLESHEVVHHKDGNRSNNAIENLELLQSHKEHVAVHAKESELYQLHKQGLLRCSACRVIKPFAAFDEGKTMRYGYKNQCKACRAEAYRRAHPGTRPHDVIMRERHQNRWLASDAYKLFLVGQKVCRHCNETKPLDDFSPYAGNKDGRMSYCRACRRGIAKEKKHD